MTETTATGGIPPDRLDCMARKRGMDSEDRRTRTMNVAICLFNRPDLTRRVFAAVRAARPERLFLIADGPRGPNDEAKCRGAREAVEAVDWPCDVRRNYSESNLGCGQRLPTGLDWVFGFVNDVIVLEDDCLPHGDFFRFCTELLERYRDDERVGHIGGTNFDRVENCPKTSYAFSIYTSNWGWATWKRAWRHFDPNLTSWPAVKERRSHEAFFRSRSETRYFEQLWTALHAGRMKSVWDGQWLFACLAQHMLSIRPAVNLVSNIGVGSDVDATHTGVDHAAGKRPTYGLTFPLRHPEAMLVDTDSDARLAEEFFRIPDPTRRWVKGTLLNRYWYGQHLRRIPGVGTCWAAWREKRKARRSK